MQAEGVCVCLCPGAGNLCQSCAWGQCAGTHRQREFVSVFAPELETCVKAVHGVSGRVHTGKGSLCPSLPWSWKPVHGVSGRVHTGRGSVCLSLPRSWKPVSKLCMGSVGCLAWAGGDKRLSPCQPVVCAFSRSASIGAPLYSPPCCWYVLEMLCSHWADFVCGGVWRLFVT